MMYFSRGMRQTAKGYNKGDEIEVRRRIKVTKSEQNKITYDQNTWYKAIVVEDFYNDKTVRVDYKNYNENEYRYVNYNDDENGDKRIKAIIKNKIFLGRLKLQLQGIDFDKYFNSRSSS